MSIINTGVSGLLAFQRALATTSHNIVNADKDGYSRQRVEIGTNTPQFLSGNFLGQGAHVSDIRRIQDEFVDAQLREYTSIASNDEVRAQYAERIDRLLGDANTGLAPALGAFFNAANDVASDPSSIVPRQVFLSESESMVGRFNELNQRINDQRELVNDQIKVTVDEINSLSESLADVNQRIVAAYGLSDGGVGGEPNDLLDERGDLLKQLAEKVDINIVEQNDRSVSVFVGNGQPLVMGASSNTLVAESFGGDPRNWDIGFSNGVSNNPVDITHLISGGELGGLLTSRSEILDKAQNGIGQLALAMSGMVNYQNRLGLDLDGTPGEDLFTFPQTMFVGADKSNTSTVDPAVEYLPDVFSLTASDYRLSHNGTDFSLTRLQDNKVFKQSDPDAFDSTANAFVVDGIKVDVTGMAPASGDNWLIQPTRFAAGNLDTLITDPSKVAVASGALAGPNNEGDALMLSVSAINDADTNYQVPAGVVYDKASGDFIAVSPTYDNVTGDATIESFKVTDPSLIVSGMNVPVTYNAADNTLNGVPLDASGTTTITGNGWEMVVSGTPNNGDNFAVTSAVAGTYVDPDDPGLEHGTTDVTHNGWELKLYNEPADDDFFSVDMSKDRPGDNRNMLAMADLSEGRFVENSATFADSYNQTLGEIGTRTRQAQVARDSSVTLRNNVQTQRDSISGVNLDEEAASLLKYQQAYQAAAQAISVGNSTFDSLFALFR
ncbi:flagellar hook-associated protein FlgK [Rhabdochromatium marinum]|uniref:flagellar hook-associated protein FlgK n=1 Tax=Rhabdochromatium marinum TaxID=48729 RepID=UPI00190399FF|nr:flagellar hook-associated protein FlgK [Rhabdochromatium marinum]MBK1647472.1 flagellar hook-associated protein FlgK [Rhabdochromatium marinum]